MDQCLPWASESLKEKKKKKSNQSIQYVLWQDKTGLTKTKSFFDVGGILFSKAKFILEKTGKGCFFFLLLASLPPSFLCSGHCQLIIYRTNSDQPATLFSRQYLIYISSPPPRVLLIGGSLLFPRQTQPKLVWAQSELTSSPGCLKGVGVLGLRNTCCQGL